LSGDVLYGHIKVNIGRATCEQTALELNGEIKKQIAAAVLNNPTVKARVEQKVVEKLIELLD